MSAAPTDALLAQASALSTSSLLDERTEFVSLVKMQQMVRVTCLEVISGGAATTAVDAYRREVVELQELVKGYLSEVRELRAQQQANAAAPPASPSSGSHTTASVPGSPGPLLTLDAQFEEAPQANWYEHKPLPRFTVRVCHPDGSPYGADDEVVLTVSLLNGRGHPEEHKVKGPGDLLAGERSAVVRGGVAEWTSLRICEPSSKHYGSFTVVIRASQAPDGTAVAEVQSSPLTVQVGRMWSKRRKTEDELGPSDSITQIPGIGARYVSRLQLHGVTTIGQFATMASTLSGRDTLCRLCKGDNPRNSLNQQKLQAMIDAANRAAGLAAEAELQPGNKRSRSSAVGGGGGGGGGGEPLALTISASEASGCGGSDGESGLDDPECEPHFSMDELLLLTSPDGSDGADESDASASPHTPHLAPLEPYGHPDYRASAAGASGAADVDEAETRFRRMNMVGVEPAGYASSGATIDILPPKHSTAATATAEGGSHIDILPPKSQAAGGLGGFAALDALAAGGALPEAPVAPTTALLAPPSRAVARMVRAAWRGDAAQVGAASASEGADGADRFGCSAVHVAALGGHAHVLASLLARPAFASHVNAPARGMGGATPLHLAACLGLGGEAAADALLDAGASASALLRGGVSAAHLAAWSGADRLLERILSTDPLLADEPTDIGLTPLDCAALGGHAACVSLLLGFGAKGGAVLPALTCAALGDDEETLALLLASHPNQLFSCGSSAGWLPLHAAAAAAALTSVRALLNAGADVDALSADGLTPLDLACACGHADVVAELVNAPNASPPPLVDADGNACTALVCAAASGEVECARVLAEAAVGSAGAAAAAMGELSLAVDKLHGYELGDAMRTIAAA